MKSETYERIKNDSRFKRFLICLFSNTYILHVPKRCVKIGWLDPIIEGHELKQGFVSLNEVMKKLSNDLPDKWQVWQLAKSDDIEELKYLLGLIDEKQDFGIYILECSYSNYGEVLTKNLKCI